LLTKKCWPTSFNFGVSEFARSQLLEIKHHLGGRFEEKVLPSRTTFIKLIIFGSSATRENFAFVQYAKVSSPIPAARALSPARAPWEND
jgi:hypothetical protein